MSIESAAEAPAPVARGEDICARLPDVLAGFRDAISAGGDHGELAPLLDVLTARACALVSVNRCAVYLLDEESGLYRGHLVRTGDRVSQSIRHFACGVDADRFTREILATRQPVLIADALSDPRPIHSAMVALDVRSVLGAPMVLRGSVIGILYLDEKGSPHRFAPEDIDVAASFANLAAIAVANARTTASLRTALGTVAKQNAALRRAAVAEHRLAELALAGADLNQIADGVAALTAKPCAIYDAAGRRIGAGSPGDACGPAWLLEPEDCARPEIASALAGVRARTTTVIGPFRTPGFSHRLLISPISVGREEWGRIVVKEQGQRFNAFDAQVTRRAATIVALALSAQRTAAELHAPNAETLVRDLISGVGEEEELARRARFHGLDLGGDQLVCLLSSRPAQQVPALAVSSVAAAAPPGALSARVPDGVLIVLPQRDPPADDPVGAARAAAEQILSALDGGYIAGVSTVFSGAAGFPCAYREARQVVRCLQTFGSTDGDPVLTAGELGAGSVFLASTTREDADEFVRCTLGPLLDLEDRPMRDLLTTLTAYLQCQRSVRETADRLGVHENTVRYRLVRISELSALDVASDIEDQLAVQLATLVLRLEGRLSAERPAAVGVDS